MNGGVKIAMELHDPLGFEPNVNDDARKREESGSRIIELDDFGRFATCGQGGRILGGRGTRCFSGVRTISTPWGRGRGRLLGGVELRAMKHLLAGSWQGDGFGRIMMAAAGGWKGIRGRGDPEIRGR